MANGGSSGASGEAIPPPLDRLRAAYDSMFDPHVLIAPVRDPSGEVTDFVIADANEPAFVAVGVRRDQLVGGRLLEMLPESRPSGMFDQCCAVVDGSDPITLYDVRSVAGRGGADRRFDIRAVRVGGAVSLTWRDVTERHRYRLLAELSSDIVFRNAPDGTVEWIAPSVTAVVGWDPAEIVGHPTMDFVHPDDHAELLAARQALLAGERVRYEARFLTADGGSRWMEVFAQPLMEPDGTVIARIGSMRDIEPQVSARREAELMNERLEAMFDLGAMVAMRVGADGFVTAVTSSVTSVLGHDPERFVGTEAESWIHPLDVQAVFDTVQTLQPGERIEGLHLRVSNAAGEYRRLAGTVQRAVGSSAEAGEVGFELVLVDITEQMRAAQVRDQLGAMASQEIRGPLAFIYGTLEMLDSGRLTLEDARGRDMVHRMVAAAERLTRVAESWGKVQRAERLVPEPLPEVDVVRIVERAAGVVPTSRGVQVVVDDRTGAGLVRRIDPDQLAEAVTNVVDNAIHHSPDGGQVDVSLFSLADGVRIAVRDRGDALPAGHHKELIDPFATSARDARDLVVRPGLAVASAIANAHTGRLTVEAPDDGSGALFLLELHEPASAR